jgi:hypothetical protein
MTAERARLEKRRRRRNEYMRAWKAARVRRGRHIPPPPEFEFHNDGTVTASDLDAQGLAAGYVTAYGQFVCEARHDEMAVFSALTTAMADNPERAWPERYRRFVDEIDGRV